MQQSKSVDAIRLENMERMEAERGREARHQRRKKAEDKIRKDLESQAKVEAKEHTQRILPFSPCKDTIDPRVYEIHRYTYVRSPHKTKAYLKPKLPADFWTEEEQRLLEKHATDEAAAEAKKPNNPYDYEGFDLELVGAGMGWQSPLEAMYSPAEKKLIGVLNTKNPLVRIKPDVIDWIGLYGGRHSNIKANEPDGHRWVQCPRWPVAFSDGTPLAHHPSKMLDGETGLLVERLDTATEVTSWSPTTGTPGTVCWVVLDLRSQLRVDGFRMVSLPSVKHTVKDFRLETSDSGPKGPWTLVDYYLFNNSDMHVGANEIFTGMHLHTRYLRIFIESTVHAANKIQPKYFGLRVEEPICDFFDLTDRDKGGMRQLPKLSIRPEDGRDYHGGCRLEIKGRNFSSCASDNTVEFFLVSPRPPDNRHVHQWYARRPLPFTTAQEAAADRTGGKYRRPPTGVVREASETRLVVSVHGMDRCMLGMGTSSEELAGTEPETLGIVKSSDEFGLLAVRVTSNTVPQVEDGSEQCYHRNGKGSGIGASAMIGSIGGSSSGGKHHKSLEHYTPCARLYEKFADPQQFVQACLHARTADNAGVPLYPGQGVGEYATNVGPLWRGGGEEEIREAVKFSMGNPDLVYWSVRAMARFDASLDDHGVPPDQTHDVLATLLRAMDTHKEHTGIHAWCVQALCHFAEDHGNRLAVMQFDECVIKVCESMKSLVRLDVETERYTDKETMEVIEETHEMLPGVCEELACAGCKFLCLMAYEEKVRDYVASIGIPAVISAMGECGAHSLAAQSVGCEALFNCVYRGEDAWHQAHDCGADAVLTHALEWGQMDENLLKHAQNLEQALQVNGWKGRKLVEDLKLQEHKYAREHAGLPKKQQWKDPKTGVTITRDNDADADFAREEDQKSKDKKKIVQFSSNS